jgi:uncharacterized membrane protein YfcA
LIDYDAALLLCPSLLAGTTVGVILSLMFPQWLVVVLLVILLAYTTHKTLEKAAHLWGKKNSYVAAPSRSLELVPRVAENSQGSSEAQCDRVEKSFHVENRSIEEFPLDIEGCRDVNTSSKSLSNLWGKKYSYEAAPSKALELVPRAVESTEESSIVAPCTRVGQGAASFDVENRSIKEECTVDIEACGDVNTSSKNLSANLWRKKISYEAAPSKALELVPCVVGNTEESPSEAPCTRIGEDDTGLDFEHRSIEECTLDASLSSSPVTQLVDPQPCQLELICETDNESTLQRIYEDDSLLFQKKKIGMTVGIWLVVFTFALLRGGNGESSFLHVSCGDELYWGLFVSNLIVLLSITILLRVKLLNKSEKMRAVGHQPMVGDLEWTSRSTIVYPVISFFAGIASGLLGIGGGMVLGPLLIALGCHPQVTAATNSWFVLITATSGLAQVLIYGLLPYTYAILFGFIGMLATIFGQTAVEFVVKKYKQDAIVVVVIGVVMLVAMFLMGAVGILNIAAGAPTAFASLCKFE